MPDPDTTVGSDGNYLIDIDQDNDELDRVFAVEHNGGGAGTRCFSVNESGVVKVFNTIERDGELRLNRATGTGNLVRFQVAGTDVAKITTGGLGVFDQEGIVTRTVTADPNTAPLPGSPGQIVFWDAGSPYYLCVCYATDTWGYLQLTL